MKYIKGLSEPWFTLIKKGYKTCEGRLNKGDFAKMEVDDIIEFRNNNRAFQVVITNIKQYDSFYDMIKKERLKNVLPDKSIKTILEGVKIYRQFYTEEDEKKYGVIAINIKTI